MTTPTDNYNPLPMMVEYPRRISTPILLEQIAPIAIEAAMTGAQLQKHAMQAAAHTTMIAQVSCTMNTTLTITISTFAPHPPIASIAKRHRPQRQEQLEEGEVQIVEIGDIPGDSPELVPIPPKVGTPYPIDISHYRRIQTLTLPAYSPH